MSATTYTPVENEWTWRHLKNSYRFTSPLYLRWEVWSDPISDNYTADEIGAVELLRQWVGRLPDQRAERLFGAGSVGISWYVEGEPFEAAPFQMLRPNRQETFLDFYSWPESTTTGERLNFNRLPVVDKLWREQRQDKGGFIQEATGWKPAPLQPVMWVGSVLDAAGIGGVTYEPRQF